MADTHKVDATNLTDGPRMFNSIPPVTIPAGQSMQDLLISQAELESMKRFAEFKITDGSEGEDADLSTYTVAELKAFAEANDIDLGGATKKDDILAAIELASEAKG